MTLQATIIIIKNYTVYTKNISFYRLTGWYTEPSLQFSQTQNLDNSKLQEGVEGG